MGGVWIFSRTIQYFKSVIVDYVVLDNIHTHLMDKGVGVSKAKMFNESMRLNWISRGVGGGGLGGSNQKIIPGRDTDIFWNNTFEETSCFKCT